MISFESLKSIFQTLSDNNRLNILYYIGEKETAVGELVKITGLSQPLVSHHLKVMKESNILDTKRRGPFVYYFIKELKILYAINLFLEISQMENDGTAPASFCPPNIQNKYN